MLIQTHPIIQKSSIGYPCHTLEMNCTIQGGMLVALAMGIHPQRGVI
uniref:Uncharacterized protein n=1 Tax=Rhizophora mucronata TaxID=61149 RepID=A0A2P2PR96_RHIMU